MPGHPIKPVVWLGDSLRVLKSFPQTETDMIKRRLRLAEALREGQE